MQQYQNIAIFLKKNDFGTNFDLFGFHSIFGTSFKTENE
jgi:hypothetical protein